MQPDADTKRAALGYAVALITSLHHTANYLGVEPRQLRRLLNGEEPVPEPLFLKAVELLMAAKVAELAAAKASMQGSELPPVTPALEQLLRKP